MSKKIVRYIRREESEDIVRSSLSEIVMFLLFFFLILLGSEAVMDTSGVPLKTSSGQKSEVLQEQLQICVNESKKCKQNESFLTNAYERLEGLTERCANKLESCAKANRWPPVFDLSEARGYSFASGKSTLSTSFQVRLKKRIIPLILKAATNQHFEITTIEIIGHTDEQAVGATTSNMDEALGRHLGMERNVPSLKPSDNAGLGLARAVAIRSFLLRDGRLKDFRIVALSAAQGIRADGQIATGATQGFSDARRRRIEIRLRGNATRYQ